MQSILKSRFATRGKSRLVILPARRVRLRDHSAREILKSSFGSRVGLLAAITRLKGSALAPSATAPALMKVLRFMDAPLLEARRETVNAANGSDLKQL